MRASYWLFVPEKLSERGQQSGYENVTFICDFSSVDWAFWSDGAYICNFVCLDFRVRSISISGFVQFRLKWCDMIDFIFNVIFIIINTNKTEIPSYKYYHIPVIFHSHI